MPVTLLSLVLVVLVSVVLVISRLLVPGLLWLEASNELRCGVRGKAEGRVRPASHPVPPKAPRRGRTTPLTAGILPGCGLAGSCDLDVFGALSQVMVRPRSCPRW